MSEEPLEVFLVLYDTSNSYSTVRLWLVHKQCFTPRSSTLLLGPTPYSYGTVGPVSARNK